LNGLEIYSLKDKQLLADRRYHCNFYSKDNVEREAVHMLMGVLVDAANAEGVQIDRIKAKRQVKKIVKEAMNVDQRQMAGRVAGKMLRA
jgi:hypothetical protein